MATINYEDIYSVLSKQDQLHLLKYYGELTPERQQALLEQIRTIDWDLIRTATQTSSALGLEALRAQKVGAVLLAGGQGTRLGFDKPKGMFNIGVTKPLYIFQCLINNLMDVVKQAGAWVPLYIMTSQKNHDGVYPFLQTGYGSLCGL